MQKYKENNNNLDYLPTMVLCSSALLCRVTKLAQNSAELVDELLRKANYLVITLGVNPKDITFYSTYEASILAALNDIRKGGLSLASTAIQMHALIGQKNAVSSLLAINEEQITMLEIEKRLHRFHELHFESQTSELNPEECNTSLRRDFDLSMAIIQGNIHLARRTAALSDNVVGLVLYIARIVDKASLS